VAGLRSLSQEPFVDCSVYASGQPPSRRVRGADGVIRIERVPHTAAGVRGRVIRMLDADGNVVDGVMSCSAAASGKSDYGDYMRELWSENGWFVYGRCPIAQVAAGEVSLEELPNEMRGQAPCELGSCDALRPCRHMLAIEQERKAGSRLKYDAINERFKSMDEKLLNATQMQSIEVAKAVAVEVAKAIASASLMAQQPAAPVPPAPPVAPAPAPAGGKAGPK
jgi:hypothetical protein